MVYNIKLVVKHLSIDLNLEGNTQLTQFIIDNSLHIQMGIDIQKVIIYSYALGEQQLNLNQKISQQLGNIQQDTFTIQICQQNIADLIIYFMYKQIKFNILINASASLEDLKNQVANFLEIQASQFDLVCNQENLKFLDQNLKLEEVPISNEWIVEVKTIIYFYVMFQNQQIECEFFITTTLKEFIMDMIEYLNVQKFTFMMCNNINLLDKDENLTFEELQIINGSLIQLKTLIQINLLFQNQKIVQQFDLGDSLQQVYDYSIKCFDLKKSVSMFYNNLNLFNKDLNSTLLDSNLEEGCILQFAEQLIISIQQKTQASYKIKFKIYKNNQFMAKVKFQHASTVQELVNYIFEEFYNFLVDFQAPNYILYSKKEQKILDQLKTLSEQISSENDELYLQQSLD